MRIRKKPYRARKHLHLDMLSTPDNRLGWRSMRRDVHSRVASHSHARCGWREANGEGIYRAASLRLIKSIMAT